MKTSIGNEAILGRLASDDIFRAQMLDDPVATLERLGIAIDAAAIPAIRSLPSKESLQQDKAIILASLDQRQAMIPLKVSD